MVVPNYLRESGVNVDVDVLCGRGGNGIHRNPGNLQYRTWVDTFRDDYVNSVKVDKVKISARIVAMVFQMGGKFVVFEERKKKWITISDQKALEKTSQALREIPRGPQSTDKFKAGEKQAKHFIQRLLSLYNCKPVLKRAQELLECRSSTAHLKIEPTEPFQYLPTGSKGGRWRKNSIFQNNINNNATNNKRKRSSLVDDLASKDQQNRETRTTRGGRLVKAPKTYREARTHHRSSSLKLLRTTLDNRPIRVETLELDDFTSSSEDDDDESPNLLPISSKIRRTLVRLDPAEISKPLYKQWGARDDDEKEMSSELFEATHDWDELVALGVMSRPDAATTLSSPEAHLEEGEEYALLLPPNTTTTTRRFFGPGQPVLFGGAVPQRVIRPRFSPLARGAAVAMPNGGSSASSPS